MTSPVDITSDAPHRQHYGLTFGVLALSGATYALLQSLVAPALPEIQRDLHTSATAVAWVLTAFLLSASIFTPILGRLGDMFGKERMLVVALVTLAFGRSSPRSPAASACSSSAASSRARAARSSRSRSGSSATSSRASASPGDRADLGHPRASAAAWASCSPGRSSTRSPTTGCSGSRSPRPSSRRSRPSSSCPSRRSGPRAGSTGSAPRCCRRGSWPCSWRSARARRWGWGDPRTIGLFAARHRAARRVGHGGEPAAEPLVDMTMMRIRGVWTVNAAAFLVGAGMYSSFILIPQFVETPASRGLRLRVERHRGGAVPAARDARRCCSSARWRAA